MYFPVPSHPLDLIILIIFFEKYKFLKLLITSFTPGFLSFTFSVTPATLRTPSSKQQDDEESFAGQCCPPIFMCESSFPFDQGRILNVSHDDVNSVVSNHRP